MSQNTDKISEAILAHRAAHAGKEPSAEDIAQATGLEPNVVAVCIGQMKRHGNYPGGQKKKAKTAAAPKAKAARKAKRVAKPARRKRAAKTKPNLISSAIGAIVKAHVLENLQTERKYVADALAAIDAGIKALR